MSQDTWTMCNLFPSVCWSACHSKTIFLVQVHHPEELWSGKSKWQLCWVSSPSVLAKWSAISWPSTKYNSTKFSPCLSITLPNRMSSAPADLNRISAESVPSIMAKWPCLVSLHKYFPYITKQVWLPHCTYMLNCTATVVYTKTLHKYKYNSHLQPLI